LVCKKTTKNLVFVKGFLGGFYQIWSNDGCLIVFGTMLVSTKSGDKGLDVLSMKWDANNPWEAF